MSVAKNPCMKRSPNSLKDGSSKLLFTAVLAHSSAYPAAAKLRIGTAETIIPRTILLKLVNGLLKLSA